MLESLQVIGKATVFKIGPFWTQNYCNSWYSFKKKLSGNLDWLVVSTPLKNMKVNWDDEIPNINGKIKFMATKPPTSINVEPLLMMPMWQFHVPTSYLKNGYRIFLTIHSWRIIALDSLDVLQSTECKRVQRYNYIIWIWLVVVYPPLWKIWVRQLGWGHSHIYGKIKLMATKPPPSNHI